MPGLDRLLTLSSKKMPTGPYTRDDPGFLEFNEIIPKRDCPAGVLQPGDMQWSMEEFIKRMDESDALLEQRFTDKMQALMQEYEEIER